MEESNKGVKVVGFWVSLFTQRVRWGLNLKGIEYEYVEEDINNKSPLLFELNPVYAKVPILVHDGVSFPESGIILEYIDQIWPHNPLLPLDPYDRAQARFWAKFADQKMTGNGAGASGGSGSHGASGSRSRSRKSRSKLRPEAPAPTLSRTPLSSPPPPIPHPSPDQSSSHSSVRDHPAVPAQDGRERVWATSGGVLLPGNEVSRACTIAFGSLPISAGAYTWSKVPKPKKLAYFEEFQKQTTWDRNMYSDQAMFRYFCKSAQQRYKDLMYEWRMAWRRDGTTQSLGKDDNDVVLWDSLTREWLDPDYIRKCEIAKANRRSDDGGGMSRHRTGARSILEQSMVIERDTGRVPTHLDRMSIAHPFNADTQQSTYGRTTNLHLEMNRRIAEIGTQVDPTQPGTSSAPTVEEVDRAYLEVAPTTRGRVLGLGRMSADVISGAGPSQTASQGSVSSTPTPDVTMAQFNHYMHVMHVNMGREMGWSDERIEEVYRRTMQAPPPTANVNVSVPPGPSAPPAQSAYVPTMQQDDEIMGQQFGVGADVDVDLWDFGP